MNNSLKRRCAVPLVMAALGLGVPTAFGQTTNVIPSTYRLPSTAADTTKPGFTWRVHQVASAQPNTSARTEAQLAGELGPNVADPNAQGIALAPASAPSPDTAPITFEIEGVLNLSIAATELGNFPADEPMPGLPGTAGGNDYIAAELTTWLDLPAGVTTLVVNSDDGFRFLLGGPVPGDQLAAVKVGEYEGGRGAGDTVVKISVATAGLYAARIAYENGTGDGNIEFFSILADGTTKVLVNDLANGGIKAYRAVTGAITKAYTRKVVPASGAIGVAPNTPIQIELVDGGSPIDAATVKLALDGTPSGATATKAGNVTTLNHTPASLFAGGSTHQATLTYTDGGTPISLSWSFTVAQYGLLTPAMKVTPDTSKPGFVWTVFANAATNLNILRRAESGLAGLLIDGDGTQLPNLADPTAQGAAIAVGTAPSPVNAPITFEIAGVINLSQAAGETNGNSSFGIDLQMPGTPATDGTSDGVSAEILTYIELPAGMVAMGVNSDDNFRTLGAAARDAAGATVLGERDPIGGGAAETTFFMLVQEAGVYAFRTLYEQGTGAANIEWFTLKNDGSKVLINDVANGGPKAYRALTTPIAPFVRMVEPPIAPRQLNLVTSNLTVVVEDGTTAVTDASVALKVDGKPVTVTKTRQGKDVVAVHTPTELFIPDEEHSAELTYTDSAGTAQTRQWKFRNLKNLVLPTPALTENFDSYEEVKAPSGWNAWNFTDCSGTFCDTPGEDPDNLESDTYKGWVVISRPRMEGLKGRVFDWNEGSQIVNGTAIDTTAFSDGNVLYAESDSRGNEVQFIISKPFDLSAVTNVVLSFSSLYEQNQDNIGAVEYSIDGGTTFMPVVYYLDFQDGGGDIKYFVDGSIDAVKTLTGANTDTANWTENGLPRGDKYGDGIAAPISQALASYIAPRWNDNRYEGKRVEVFRLPAAGRKSDVRLRFAQLGTGSWYFGVDNIAFYEGPAPATAPASARLAISASGANVTISWTGAGTLQEATSIGGTWTASASQTSPQTVTASGTKFYRVSQ